MYLHSVPKWWQKVWPEIIWSYPKESDSIFLTFDDGPVAGLSEAVIEILQSYQAKATFFCTGQQAKANPGLLDKFRAAEHLLGNHSFHHYSAWSCSTETYLKDVAMAAEWIPSKLYRPPYGRLSWSTYQALKKNYKIVMWDVMPGDFQSGMDAPKCLESIQRNAKPGSVIVLHEKQRTKQKLLKLLPPLLDYFSEQNWQCKILPDSKK